MDDEQLVQHNRFWVQQKFTLMVNRYTVSVALPDGSVGEEVCFVEQKRMAFKEEVTFHRGGVPYFRFKARRVMDLGATYDVTAVDGTPIGVFRKDFGKSLLRSTWHLQTPDGLVAVGQERSKGVAIARRVIDLVGDLPIFLRFHFDFTASDGQIILTSERQRSLRDRYEISVPVLDNGWQLDWRVAAAMAVALDALQAR